MPCREWFDEQDDGYRDSVIPPSVKARVSVEAAVPMGWREIVGDAGRIISINHYGASASAGTLFSEFGFSGDTVAAAAKESIAAASSTDAPTASRTERPQVDGRSGTRRRRHHQLSLPTSKHHPFGQGSDDHE